MSGQLQVIVAALGYVGVDSRRILIRTFYYFTAFFLNLYSFVISSIDTSFDSLLQSSTRTLVLLQIYLSNEKLSYMLRV